MWPNRTHGLSPFSFLFSEPRESGAVTRIFGKTAGDGGGVRAFSRTQTGGHGRALCGRGAACTPVQLCVVHVCTEMAVCRRAREPSR